MSRVQKETTDITPSLVDAYCKLNPYPVYRDIIYFQEAGDKVGISPPEEVLSGDRKFDESKIHRSEVSSKLLSEAEQDHFSEDEKKDPKLDTSSYAKWMDSEWREGLEAFKGTLKSVMQSEEYLACQDDNAKYSYIASSGTKPFKELAAKAVEDSGIKYDYAPETPLYKALVGKSSSFIAQKLLEKTKKEKTIASAGEIAASDLQEELKRFHPVLAAKMVKIGRKMAEMEKAEKSGGFKAAKLKVMNCFRSFINGVCGYKGKNIDASLEQFKNDLNSPRYAMDKLKMHNGGFAAAPSKARITRGR